MAKVLIVDDAEMNAEVLAEMVKMLGPETETASNGKEAVELVRQKYYDLIFMDHLMPVMDGMEALSVMKRENLCHGVPIVMVTANDSALDGTMYLKAGFSDYMKKPFSAKIVEDILIKYGIIGSVTVDEVWKELQQHLKGLNLQDSKKYFLFDPTFYVEILKEYEQIESSSITFGKPDMSDIGKYLYAVRAAKDSARLIGAQELANEALLMEEGIKDDDEEAFLAHLERFRDLDKRLKRALSRVKSLTH